MKILSLFDGMACGMIAMLNAGIEVESYDAYEYDETSANSSKGRPYGFAAQVASHNFPNIRQHGDVFKADFTQYEGVDYLVGGSPCTYWSIAQKNNRETEASGMGWELFSQYVRAVKEAKPRFFIYENNYSMSAAIRASIDEAFGFEAVHINSALVSAQNRQRLYWVGMRNEDGTYSKVPVDQPVDRGILLRDVLELSTSEQPYEIQTVGIGYRGRMEEGKWIKRYESNCEQKANAVTTVQTDSMVAEPVRVGDIGSTAQAHRVYSCDGKSVTINAGGGGQGGKTGLYLCPILSEREVDYMFRKDGRTDYGYIQNTNRDKAQCITANIHKGVPYNCLFQEVDGSLYLVDKNGCNIPVYEVKDGMITVKGKRYHIKLTDGYYIIRKLTVRECMRLQTVPEWYDFSVISNSQAYKCLGNGWTCEVITHLIHATQKAARRKWLDDLLGDCL
jgi:DNA (cytosine-5)-methyltransferase 3A